MFHHFATLCLTRHDGFFFFFYHFRAALSCPLRIFPQFRHLRAQIAVVHDTAARNMIAAGIPESRVMKICGWTTDSMLRRYATIAARRSPRR